MIDVLSREQKSQMIDDAIEKMSGGEIVDLIDASGCAYALCIGDFRDNGMATKNVWRTGMNWTWNGPGTIRLHGGEILHPGQQSEDVDMDWS